jgi:hypothetical protein
VVGAGPSFLAAGMGVADEVHHGGLPGAEALLVGTVADPIRPAQALSASLPPEFTTMFCVVYGFSNAASHRPGLPMVALIMIGNNVSNIVLMPRNGPGPWTPWACCWERPPRSG